MPVNSLKPLTKSYFSEEGIHSSSIKTPFCISLYKSLYIFGIYCKIFKLHS